MERVTHAMRREYWKSIVQECNQSGMKKKDWLSEHHINPKAFYRWQKRLRLETGTEMILKHVEETNNMPEFALITQPTIRDIPMLSAQSDVQISIGKASIRINEEITDEFLIRIFKVISHV